MEPQWLPDDFDAALEWQEAEAAKCPGCGRWRDESFAENGPEYHTTPHTCWSCFDKDVTARAVAQQNGGSVPGGVYFATEEMGDG